MSNNIPAVQKSITIVVVTSYLLKIAVKLITGILLAIPPLIADAIHGIFDIIEHGFLVLGGFVARKQRRDKYPIDRQPLIDLLGLIIFIGLTVFGITLIINGLEAILNVFLGLGYLSFLERFINATNGTMIESIEGSYLVYAAIVMFFSYFISESVYRYEYRLADENNIYEMKADAIELRSDGWLELGIGGSLFIAWLLHIILLQDNDQSVLILPIVMGVILTGLGGYLIYIAYPDLYHNYQNLMNRALEPEERAKLENMLNDRLPKHCKIITPLITFHRGNQLWVKGNVIVDRNIMTSVDIIIGNLEKITKLYLSHLKHDIYVQYSPVFEWSHNSINTDIESILQDIWMVYPHTPMGQAYKSLKYGKLDDSIKWVENNEAKNKYEKILSDYMKAYYSSEHQGPSNALTKRYVQSVKKLIGSNVPNNIKLMLSSWLLIYTTSLHKNNKKGIPAISKLRNMIYDELKEEDNINDIVRAEANFALGFSWERSNNYDVDRCISHYKMAEYYYIKSGMRFEMDRLMNTWGHLETLLYKLGDATMHLELAKDIKEVKGDKIGLTYTYGCLGDLYNRTGEYDNAIHYYKKDLDLLQDLNIKYPVNNIMVKYGETKIKKGYIFKDVAEIKEGVELCEETLNNTNTDYFAKKGIIKGYLYILMLNDASMEVKGIDKKVDDLLTSLSPQNTYENAFYHRLFARYYGLGAQNHQAIENINKAKSKYLKLSDSMYKINFSIQSLICDIEEIIYHINSDNIDDIDLQALHELQLYLDSMGGMLGKAGDWLQNNIKEVIQGVSEKTITSNQLKRQIYKIVCFAEG